MVELKHYYALLEGKTDKEMILVIGEHLDAVHKAGGDINPSYSYGVENNPPRILLDLPDGVSPESVIPDLTFEEVH